jgi:hypothetical protein
MDAMVQQRHFLQMSRLFGGLGNDDVSQRRTIDAVHHHAPSPVDLPNGADRRHGQAQCLGLSQGRCLSKHGTLGHTCLVELDDGFAELEDLGFLARAEAATQGG